MHTRVQHMHIHTHTHTHIMHNTACSPAFSGWRGFAPCFRCLPRAPPLPPLPRWSRCCRRPSTDQRVMQILLPWLLIRRRGSVNTSSGVAKHTLYLKCVHFKLVKGGLSSLEPFTRGVGAFSTSRISFPMLPLSWILCMASFTWEQNAEINSQLNCLFNWAAFSN